MPLPLADDALTASRHETTEMGGGTEDGITTGGFCIDTAHAHVDDSDASSSSLGARKAENWFIEWAQVKVERRRRER